MLYFYFLSAFLLFGCQMQNEIIPPNEFNLNLHQTNFRDLHALLQGQSRQTVNFDFDLMGTSYKIVLGFIGYKWALVMDISLSEAKMLKYQS